MPAVSQQQAKYFRWLEHAPDAAAEREKSGMSHQQLHDFAATPNKGLPVRAPHKADGHVSYLADGTVEDDAGPGYSSLKMAPDPIPTAQDRFTRTPIAFGQTYNAADPNTASTLYNSDNSQAVRIEANNGDDPIGNKRMLRHEAIHTLLVGNNVDRLKAANDPAVQVAAAPIKRLFQSQGYRGDLDTELPAYMGSFSNEPGEWTGGVPSAARDAYLKAFTAAIAKQNPQTAVQYQRMLMDTTPGSPASQRNLYPNKVAGPGKAPPHMADGRKSMTNQSFQQSEQQGSKRPEWMERAANHASGAAAPGASGGGHWMADDKPAPPQYRARKPSMMADGKKPEKWASEAFKPSHKGMLHRALNVPEGKKIPASKMQSALHSDSSHVRHMAQAAKNI